MVMTRKRWGQCNYKTCVTFWSSAQASITAASLMHTTMTSSTPLDFSSLSLAKYPGICLEDQVGVKAPGRPTTMTVLPLTRSAMLTSVGGKPLYNTK